MRGLGIDDSVPLDQARDRDLLGHVGAVDVLGREPVDLYRLVFLRRVYGVDDGLVLVALRRPVVVEVGVVVRPGLGKVDHAGHAQVDVRLVAPSRPGFAAGSRHQLLADVPRGHFKREEVGVRARDGADGQEPDVVRRSELEAGIANFRRRRELFCRRGEHVVLRGARVSVRDLVLVERRRVGVRYLHRIARDEDRNRVCVPRAAVLAALERPAHAVCVLLHPVYVDSPRRIGSLAQREDAVVLRAVRIEALVLVVVRAELVLLRRRGGRGDGRRPQALRGVARSVRCDRLAYVALHLHDVRLADLDDLNVLQRIV